MRASVASLSRKVVAALVAGILTFSMAPLAWADDGPAGTIAGTVAGNAAEGSENQADMAGTEGTDSTASPDAQAPEAEVQSADTKAAASTGDAATGTTIKIAVYRSSYPLVWDLNDAGAPDATKAKWDSKPEKWPTEGSPGSAVGTCEGYVAWTDDKNPGSEPSRTGFNFMGWSTSPTVAVEGTGKLDTLSIPKDTQPAAGEDGVKSITLHALWAPINYSVVFDLTKNPEDATAVPAFTWTGKGDFSDLGGGRYRLSGVTLEDYDPSTGLIEIATPARGTGGYRFLSWAEPDSQQDPTVAVRKSGSSKWYVNPVALPHYDYEPVLTARWSLSFDVDVPSQITFDEYDSLEVEGNLTDTTDEDAIDEESPDAHDAGKRAHFCSQSTATDYKIVALRSVRQPTASDILTTSDSTKATQEEVLGNERLLSLFAEGATAESQGVHFKLDDAIDMDDSARYGSFVIPKQAVPFDPSATERDDENRLYVSYRLNLSNKVGDSETPNHGLVTPGSVNEGDRTPIAEVSYEFAVADHATVLKEIRPSATPSTTEHSLYIDIPDSFLIQNGLFDKVQAGIFGLADIKAAANDLSANAANLNASAYYPLYKALLESQVTNNGNPGSGPYFQVKINSFYLPVQLIGICQDTKTAGGKAGLTFQMRDVYAARGITNSDAGSSNFDTSMNPTRDTTDGWKGTQLQKRLQSSFMQSLASDLQSAIVPLNKYHQINGSDIQSSLQPTTGETIWVPSAYEVFGAPARPEFNESEALVNIPGYTPFQYQAYQGNDTPYINEKAFKRYNGSISGWWLRTAYRAAATVFCHTNHEAEMLTNYADIQNGLSPCFAI